MRKKVTQKTKSNFSVLGLAAAGLAIAAALGLLVISNKTKSSRTLANSIRPDTTISRP